MVIVSIGFETTTKIASGEYLVAPSRTIVITFELTPTSSSRVIPGLRGTPEVITITSEFAVFE